MEQPLNKSFILNPGTYIFSDCGVTTITKLLRLKDSTLPGRQDATFFHLELCNCIFSSLLTLFVPNPFGQITS